MELFNLEESSFAKGKVEKIVVRLFFFGSIRGYGAKERTGAGKLVVFSRHALYVICNRAFGGDKH